MSVKHWAQQQKISAQYMTYHHCCYCYNSTWLRRVTVKRRKAYEIYFTMQRLVSNLGQFPFRPKTLMFGLQTFKIPPGALLITCFLHCCESPSVILGLSLHCDCSLLQVTPLCGLPVSFQSYRFLSFLIGGLPFHMSPAFIFFHSSSAEGIKLNVFKARKLEYLSLKNSAHSNMHVWGHYTVLRTGRRFGTSVGNE